MKVVGASDGKGCVRVEQPRTHCIPYVFVVSSHVAVTCNMQQQQQQEQQQQRRQQQYNLLPHALFSGLASGFGYVSNHRQLSGP